MRVLMIVKATAETEAGVMPTTEQVEEMGAFNNELIAAGVMVDGAGLHPSSKGARLGFKNGKRVITDGPFAETKEAMLGFYVLDCADQAEAIAIAQDLKAANPSAIYEIRPIVKYVPGTAFPAADAGLELVRP